MENLSLSKRRERLSEAKRILLARHLRGEAALGAEAVIPRHRGFGALPASFAQQRLWFLDRLSPGGTMYNLSAAYRLRGSINVSALEESLNAILGRHEALRTTFESSDGQLTQVVAPALCLPLQVIDLGELAEGDKTIRMLALVGEEANNPFDLVCGPLIRWVLLRLSEEDHVFLLTQHHIISDGWSMGIFFRELAALYGERNGGHVATLPVLPLQYTDFAAWQRMRLADAGLKPQLDYWKEHLKEAPVLDLPLDYPRPAMQTFSGASISASLPKELLQALRHLAQAEDATLFVTLLAAFKLLLARYAGQQDVVIGTPMAGRHRGELENLIGFFVNTLVLRTQLSGAPTFCELLRRTRETVVGAYEHQDVPFETLVETLQPPRDLSRPPLFQVFFNMISFVDEPLALPGLEVESMAAPDIRSKFDLTLYAGDSDENLSLLLLYNPDLFKYERMAEWLRQFHNLLWQIVENPYRPIGKYSLLSQAAAARVPDPLVAHIERWNGGVHHHFSKRARQAPDRVAIIERDEHWSYGELNSCSNRIAHWLRSGGIDRGDVVAVYASRCAGLVPALLGILKAGAAFTILDCAYPTPVLIERLQSAKPRGWIQLTATRVVPRPLLDLLDIRLPNARLELSKGTALITDPVLAAYPACAPTDAIEPHDLAYVAFTSGTTGAPKGILGTHAPLMHFIRWHRETFGLEETDRFAMLSGLSHDPLLRDIFTPLCTGGTLFIPASEDISIPGGLARWLYGEQITVLHLTPGLGQIITENGNTHTLPGLRYAFFAADLLTRYDVARLTAIAPGVTCVNFYGATETPQAMGFHIVPNNVEQASLSGAGHADIPVGRGIEGVQLCVLNGDHQLCGIGELGEIYIRTPYLARGYLDNDTLTAERFIINPFTGCSRDRMYRTGDLGRYGPEGEVSFAGRIDDQIKVRGFRVEPRAVEAVLSQYPGMASAAVLPRLAENGGRIMVAYVAPEAGVELDTSALARFIRERLPDYMAPASFEILQALPLTPNGKLDRRALPDPNFSRSLSDRNYIKPRSPTEQRLADIWSELLCVPRVGLDDSFFDLGGHSLLAMQLLSRILNVCQVDVPLRRLFDNPTLAALAAAIDESPVKASDSSLPAIRRLPRKQQATSPTNTREET